MLAGYSVGTPPVRPQVPMQTLLNSIHRAAGGSAQAALGASAPGLSAPGIGQDPGYAQAEADEKAALAAAASHRDSATNQAFIQFGGVPDFSSIGAALGLSPAQISSILGEIDPNTRALADQYTKSGDSVLGRLNQAHDQALSSLRAQLAARGTLESGATGVGTGLENRSYQGNLSGAYSNLMNSLLGYQSDYLNAEQSARSGLESAASDAYNRAVQMAEQYPGLYSTVPGGGGGGAADRGLVVPPAGGAPPLVSEHGAGGGYTPAPRGVHPGGLSRNKRQGVYTIH